MMKELKYIIALVCVGISLSLSAQQQSSEPEPEKSIREERNEIRAGNKHFKVKEYDLAEKQYRKALDVNPNSEVAIYNLATTLYKKEKWEEARKEYTSLLSTSNKERRAQVFHNLGNISFKEKNFGQSVEEYKEALRLNPKDDETRYNLRVAQLLLEEQQNNQQNQDQQQDKQEQQQQDKQEQQQQDKQEQQEEQEQQQDKQEQQQDQNKPQEQNEEQQQEQQAQPQPEQMTRENAEQILRAIEQDERETQEKVKERMMEQQKRKKTDKEW